MISSSSQFGIQLASQPDLANELHLYKTGELGNGSLKKITALLI